MQNPKAAMTAQEAAADIATVLNRRFQPDSRGRQQPGGVSLPARIRTGGGWLKYLLLGFLQQWLAPWLLTDRLLPKRFGLVQLGARVEQL